MRDYYQGKDQTIQRVLRLYRRGLTAQAIADQLDIHCQTVANYLRRNNVPIHPHNRQWRPQKVSEAVRLYQGGLSLGQIAKRLGGKPTTVRKYIVEAGIEVRSKAYYSQGERSAQWKGGRRVQKGYIYLYSPDHPNRTKSNMVSEHRLVMEKILGRYLLPTEVVDHINGKPDDNRHENLRLFASNAEHLRVTLKGRCPKWTEDGKRRISEAVRRRNVARRQSDTHSPQIAGADR